MSSTASGRNVAIHTLPFTLECVCQASHALEALRLESAAKLRHAIQAQESELAARQSELAALRETALAAQQKVDALTLQLRDAEAAAAGAGEAATLGHQVQALRSALEEQIAAANQNEASARTLFCFAGMEC